MARQASPSEVASYLRRAKPLIVAGHVVIIPSQKNRATLAALGLRYQHQVEILLALTPQNYCETLPPQAPSREEAWVFGTREQGMDIYIKFVLEEHPDTHDTIMCFSLHEADGPLRYAYQSNHMQQMEEGDDGG